VGDYFAKPVVPGQVEVLFSPKGGCTVAVVRELRQAKSSVYVQAYSFTNAEIAKALVDAHRRGVKVSMVLDKSQETERYSEADFTSRAGIPTSIDAAHAIAHNKVMILDEATVITGSFNFTKAAEERNAENLVIIHESPALAAKYLTNWKAHLAHSGQFARRVAEKARKR
jgi:phosphatidylserine/phosphatidylglycerophosphate/cardiolipin synthase-like enzyme